MDGAPSNTRRLTTQHMPLTTDSLQLFGLDLGRGWQALRQLWHSAQQQPPLSWLTPDLPIRVLHADGRIALWLGQQQAVTDPDDKALAAARFEAIEVPEALLLHKSFTLPPMAVTDSVRAIELEAQSSSPFAPHDLVWGYQMSNSEASADTGGGHVHLVLASRQHVQAHVQNVRAQLSHPEGLPEVWARSTPLGTPSLPPVVLPGWGEAARQHAAAQRRHLAYGLLLCISVLLCAIALTPTAQLRLRAIEATHAYEALQQQAAPAQAQREAYLHSVEQLTQVRGVLAERAAPLRLLQLLTETLPDGSFLHSLKTQGLKVTVQGMTPDAAALMQALGRVPGLREVKAPSAAVRNPGASLDSFLIEFQLDPDLLSQAPPASVAPPADAATSATSSPPAAQTAQDAQPPATAASTQALPIAAVASEPAAQPLNTAPRKSRFSMGGS